MPASKALRAAEEQREKQWMQSQANYKITELVKGKPKNRPESAPQDHTKVATQAEEQK